MKQLNIEEELKHSLKEKAKLAYAEDLRKIFGVSWAEAQETKKALPVKEEPLQFSRK